MCAFLHFYSNNFFFFFFLLVGRSIGGRVHVCLSFGVSVFFPFPFIVFFSFCLSVSFSSVSSFPSIVHNTEKLQHALDYLFHFIWCHGVLTWKRLWRYSNIPLSCDRCVALKLITGSTGNRAQGSWLSESSMLFLLFSIF